MAQLFVSIKHMIDLRASLLLFSNATANPAISDTLNTAEHELRQASQLWLQDVILSFMIQIRDDLSKLTTVTQKQASTPQNIQPAFDQHMNETIRLLKTIPPTGAMMSLPTQIEELESLAFDFQNYHNHRQHIIASLVSDPGNIANQLQTLQSSSQYH